MLSEENIYMKKPKKSNPIWRGTMKQNEGTLCHQNFRWLSLNFCAHFQVRSNVDVLVRMEYAQVSYIPHKHKYGA